MSSPKFIPKISGRLFILVAISICGPAFAQNPSKPTGLSCKGIAINMGVRESIIEANCKVTKLRNDNQIVSGQSATKVKTDDPLEERDPTVADLSKIKFATDDGSMHLCYYRNNQLVKCNALD